MKTITLDWSILKSSEYVERKKEIKLGSNSVLSFCGVPRFTRKTQFTGKTAEIQERPKNNRELKYYIHLVYAKYCINLFWANSILYVYCQFNLTVLNI